MARPKARKLSKKETKYLLKKKGQVNLNLESVPETPISKKVVDVPNVLTIRKLAELANAPVAKVIEVLFKNGIRATINESIDFETAAIVGDEFGLDIRLSDSGKTKSETVYDESKLKIRPPVVAVMGHVDHGKTKLLDAIRQTNVVEKESGGITQHIGAYQVSFRSKDESRERVITFLDTPGHEAFSALRAHGANITDIVVLVIAADDGIKPQTLEALSHARSANVPIIVALNKIDLPTADVQKVMRELAEQNLLPEEWGGKTPVVKVSAKHGTGIKDLLEIILLTFDINPAKADPTAKTQGTIVESHLDTGAGPIVTAIVIQGTIKVGDIIVAGKSWGKIKFLKDWQGNKVPQALPGTPVLMAGLKTLPQFGDIFEVVDSEISAREMSGAAANALVGQSVVVKKLEDNENKYLSLIIKADVSASLEAITTSIKEMKVGLISTKIVSSGIGPVSEGDITLAATTQAKVIAFRVPVSQIITRLALNQKIEINRYDVIYQLIDDVRSALKKLVEPKVIKTVTGRLPIEQVFMQSKDMAIAGGTVKEGALKESDYAWIERESQNIGEAKITSLQQGKTSAKEVKKGSVCGLRLAKLEPLGYKIKPGDKIVAYITEKILTE